MAEGLAAVGAIASIVQLIDFSTKVILRLREFHSLAGELPTSLRHVSAELPVLSTALESICQNLKPSPVDSKLEAALLSVVSGCHGQIAQLDAIIAKTLPTADDKFLKKSKKAIASLQREDKVENTTKILRNYIATLTFYNTAVASTIQPLKDAKLIKIREWLVAPDPSTNYQKALKLHQDDTGLWFLESDQYAEWKKSKASFLWLHGIPGCGKTVLSSAILQNVLQHCEGDPGKVVAYFFFDFNDTQKQDAERMVRSLIFQLSQQCVTMPTSLDTLFSSCDNGQRQPSLEALLEVLKHMMQEFPCVYIVLDALDECSGRTELMKILDTMSAWQLDNLHKLLTSRKEREIQISIETFIHEQNHICIQSALVDKDIQKYVQQRLSNDKNLCKWGKDPTLKQNIETAITKGAQGMFRWAVCQLDTLGKCRTRTALQRALVTLPPTLDETYDRILSAISETDSKYAIPILRWLTFAARPLTVDEVAEVVGINLDGEARFNRDEILEDPLDVLDVCSSLVIITTEKSRIQGPGKPILTLAHYSVKEYLTSDRIQKGSAAHYSMDHAVCHDTIARSCLGYLLQFQGDKMLNEDNAEEFRLADYSAIFWTKHAQSTQEQAEWCPKEAIALLSEKNDAYVNWLRIHDPDEPWMDNSFERSLKFMPLPLYYASYFGLEKVVKLLLEKGADVNAQGGFYDYALQAASYNSHEQIVKILLNAGANINAQSRYHSSALHVASTFGHEQIVKILLDAGADANARGRPYVNAQGIRDPNVQAEEYNSALQAASIEGHEVVVKLLLDAGANVNAQSRLYGNALQAASKEGREVVVRVLLDAGADANAQCSGYYDTALQAASKKGYEQVVKILLNAGADVNAQTRKGESNALIAASGKGHEAVVKQLLSAGADINTKPKSGYYGTALLAASKEGYEQVVKILLDAGADINAQGEVYDPKGGNSNAQDKLYGNALGAALRGGHETVVKLLRNAGADEYFEVRAVCDSR